MKCLTQISSRLIIENAGPMIGPKDIEVLEVELGAKLAAGYLDFLSRYNGGIPTPDTIDVPNAPGTPTDVQVFFGIGRAVETSNLSWNLAHVADRCPGLHVLPIACDSGGNLFCLIVEQGITTTVVYCDLESSDCVFYEVASSFEAFLQCLRAFGQ